MICLSVAQSNYVNIVSNCKVLRDLGERGSEGVFALGKKKNKSSESLFFFPSLRQILYKTFHHPNLSSAQAFGR